MKKQEKTQKTKERILAAAIQEFGSKSYDAASVNSICEAGQIPKGLIYHNFKGKDELYLPCVKNCYDKMMAALDDIVVCIVFFTTIAIVAGNLSAGDLPAYMIALVVILPLLIGGVTGLGTGIVLKKRKKQNGHSDAADCHDYRGFCCGIYF